MIYQKINLDLKGQAPDCAVQTYFHENSAEIEENRKRPLILVCAGGGMTYRSFREEEPVAVKLLSLGYHVAVLEYSCEPAAFPAQLLQAFAAIAYFRQHADEYHINPDKIYVMGFSAGGHLAGQTGVFWHKPYYAGKLSLTPNEVRPNALILCYAVLTAGEFTHEPTVKRYAGGELDVKRHTLSLEKQVSADTPPTFLWGTVTDMAVPVENTLLFSKALRANKVPMELHLFGSGSHGLSLASEETFPEDRMQPYYKDFAVWPDLMHAWLKRL
ncbi:MAG: alpha/beta hydrolase [Christensenellales bacterium]|jgi:acetyl esterase/lipase